MRWLCMVQVGVMYLAGKDIEQSDEKAFTWLMNAANKGVAQAQYNIGNYYLEGIYLEQDYEKAFSWFRKAALQGDPYAQYNLGLMYIEGLYAKQNLPEGYAWWAISSDALDLAKTNSQDLWGKLSIMNRLKAMWRIRKLKEQLAKSQLP
ncbi:tetratricopeptide repeat protein [Vibrio alginolyticus]|uniref:tetratricopeptide repeat protein n=1 Tax=Vibrio alginolyticus TaxID=663 RepID=UPI003753E98F